MKRDDDDSMKTTTTPSSLQRSGVRNNNIYNYNNFRSPRSNCNITILCFCR